MNLLGLKEYFEYYATIHCELKHVPEIENERAFFCVNTEEKSNQYIRNAKMDLIMVLMPYDKSQSPPAGENYNWIKNTCFLVLKRCDSNNNDEIISAQSQCEQIADDFCTVMINDRHSKLRSLESGSITMSPVGPVVDSHYGYICMFNIIDSFNHYVDPERWL